ncbi:MAG: outer membrane protein assembly factor BamA [Alistipes senegalensis]|uniref:outer membrane protein assembly factor BamA n=2 Tax=Rikenellaceae TaxID=171550 RepID=UPI0023F29AE8|nr:MULTISPECIES: outer membrane protein assembly factor BamA [Alistipes]MBD9302939.1 outer membrane protein assembly factor BamA [Alistipes senegalensis]MBQ7892909.1 outer membrane protein assembly factor BamA [Alistipes sp.]MCI7306907.1 outer membrane protein assembly factor BamA [Alistipes senegalensis]MDD7038807.1 outer membrane protein assembly factor BamA [Alistipes senegalensis]MDY2875565.1 outer membrane protein assembly factor BamA [Alistipes senegalensis]
MNYSGKIFTAAAALVLCCSNIFAQEQNPQDTTAAPKPAVSENAPMYRNDGAPRLYHIRNVNVHGVQYLNPDILKSSAGLIEGDSIYLPSNFISNAISRLWSQRFFSDVKIGAEIEGDSLDLEVFLKERPRVYNWEFEGISKGKKKDLLEKLKLKRGSELSDYVIDKNQKLIKQYWAEKGFRNTEVGVRIDNDTLRPGQAVTVTFLIDRKSKVKIGKINFTGNEQFPDKRLRRTFKKTHQKSINFFKGAKLNEGDYENDKELLIDFYNSKGYRNATIVSDSIYPINEKRLGIDIDVSEGNKYYIRNVSWVGNSVYETDDLQRMFGVKKGDTYDKKSMHKRLGIGKEENPEDMSVKSLYQNEGYLMSQIEPAEVIIAPDSIDIEVKVFEGKQFTINEVGITGNQRVDDEVIRRELYTRPGELYNRSLLMQTIRTLGSMGHFNPEAVMPDIKPVTNDLVNVNWPLEEQASDQFNIAGGWGSGTFVGSVGITLNNLSIKNTFKKGAWRPYPMGQNQRLSLSAQTNGTYYKAFAFSFTDPWMGGKKPNSFTLSAHFSEQNNAYYVWQSATQYFRTYGVAAGLGKRLNWPDPYFTFYAEANYERYNLKNWTGFVVENGNSNLLSLKLVLARNSVDQPIYPRRGSEFSASVQATLPYSLWDGKDYSDQSMSDQDRYRWIEFHKWQFKAQWFQGFLRNSNLVLMLKAEMGYLGSYNKNKVSPFQRFEVGGDGMSGYNIYGIDIIAMRGYEDGALDPSSYYSRGYNKYTAELRYPIILKPSSQIYVLGFLEGGNAFDSWKKFSPFRIKRSAGFGVRLYLPVVGMLGIDWGYGFDPPANSTTKSGSQFHFVLGQQF